MYARMPTVLALVAMTAAPVMAQSAPPPARGQRQSQQTQQAQQAQQQTRMQQQFAQQMTEMIQRMDRLRERIHQVDRNLGQQMDRLQDRDRIREHQMLRDMCANFSDTTREMQRNAERLREMSRERLFMEDPEMQREMERLREQWREMGARMQEGAESLERMQQRLGEPPPNGS